MEMHFSRMSSNVVSCTLQLITSALLTLVVGAGPNRGENITVPYGENEYGYWGAEGTDYPCLTSEDCAEYYNNTDVDDTFLLEDDVGEPCIVQGHLRRSKNWYGYLATPTLRAQVGRIYYRFVYPSSKCCVKMLLYLEEQVSDLRARMNCLQRQSILDPTGHQVITLSPSFETSGCVDNRTENGEKMIECTSGRTLRSDQDRNWYIAASSCGSPTGLDVHFSLVIYGWKGECTSETLTAGSQRPTVFFWALPFITKAIHPYYVHFTLLITSILGMILQQWNGKIL